MEKTIGIGAYGEVKLARHKKFNMQCAVKILKKSKVLSSESRAENLQSELEVLESICHPHLAHTYELLYDDRNYYVVMELVRTGDLSKYLQKRNF